MDDTVHDGTQRLKLKDYLDSIASVLHDEGYLAMRYLKNVSAGDKRLIVVNGHILAASLRLPPDGSWLCNVARGGRSLPAEPDDREVDIIQRIHPVLARQGILIYGVDTLVDDDGRRILSEVNSLSIGGFPQAEQQTGRPIIRQTLDLLFDYVRQHPLH